VTILISLARPSIRRLSQISPRTVLVCKNDSLSRASYDQKKQLSTAVSAFQFLPDIAPLGQWLWGRELGFAASTVEIWINGSMTLEETSR
jgi:hypothetical protein